MKTIEEKAKRKVFPELKESEDDKIRKELIETIHLAYDCGFSLNKEQHDKYIAWIEKQGEQKPVEWSEEELATAKKDAFNEALDKIEYSSGEPTFDDGWSAAVSFFRKRNIVPQKQWKPSSQQICSVDYVIKEYESTNISLNKEAAKQLISLREQLKTLNK